MDSLLPRPGRNLLTLSVILLIWKVAQGSPVPSFSVLSPDPPANDTKPEDGSGDDTILTTRPSTTLAMMSTAGINLENTPTAADVASTGKPPRDSRENDQTEPPKQSTGGKGKSSGQGKGPSPEKNPAPDGDTQQKGQGKGHEGQGKGMSEEAENPETKEDTGDSVPGFKETRKDGEPQEPPAGGPPSFIPVVPPATEEDGEKESEPANDGDQQQRPGDLDGISEGLPEGVGVKSTSKEDSERSTNPPGSGESKSLREISPKPNVTSSTPPKFTSPTISSTASRTQPTQKPDQEKDGKPAVSNKSTGMLDPVLVNGEAKLGQSATTQYGNNKPKSTNPPPCEKHIEKPEITEEGVEYEEDEMKNEETEVETKPSPQNRSKEDEGMPTVRQTTTKPMETEQAQEGMGSEGMKLTTPMSEKPTKASQSKKETEPPIENVTMSDSGSAKPSDSPTTRMLTSDPEVEKPSKGMIVSKLTETPVTDETRRPDTEQKTTKLMVDTPTTTKLPSSESGIIKPGKGGIGSKPTALPRLDESTELLSTQKPTKMPTTASSETVDGEKTGMTTKTLGISKKNRETFQC